MLDPPGSRDGDLLAQPSRQRLFGLLVELRRPAGTAELADRLGLHPNGVRIHLERLQAGGLVVRARARGGRGRPPDAWTVAPGARPGGERPRAYRDLGRWLARSLSDRRAVTPRALEHSGREIGRELAPAGARPGPEAVEQALAALGFDPSVPADGDGERALMICLGNCPYRDVVHVNQTAVCALHKGITAGLVEVLAPELTLAAFVPHDPDEAGCVIELSGAGARDGRR
jgi:predicted ArsR family transcriptional regulator